MTAFTLDNIEWDGMYMMFLGDYAGAVRYEAGPDTHPSRVGTVRPAFLIRMKYGPKPAKTIMKFLVKNFTVEEYLAAVEATSPLEALESKGFTGFKPKKPKVDRTPVNW